MGDLVRWIANRAAESDIVEAACRAWYDADLLPGKYNWDALVSQEDGRIQGWRLRMRAALEAIGALAAVEGV